MTLYLKYRPQILSDLDLTSVRESLLKIVKSGSIPHAFLFSGPRGTGKTSAARILAKAINCEKTLEGGEPCNKCDQCISTMKASNMDVIELDAASHRGIDDVRALRDAVKLSPAKAKKKVYIIDEAHMLTTEASNALLKTLEEPPDHVVFILATTNPEKLISTIRSRTTNIFFPKATSEELVSRLEKVAKVEKIKIDKGALDIVAEASDGSFRDAVKQFEQLLSEGVELSKSTLSEYFFKRETFDSVAFIKFLSDKKIKEALDVIENAISQGVTSVQIAKSSIETLRKFLMVKVGFPGEDFKSLGKNDLIKLIELMFEASSQIQGSFIEQVPLEIAVIKWCDDGVPDRGISESPEKITEKDKNKNTKSEPPDKVSIAGSKTDSEKKVFANGSPKGISQEIWLKVMSMVRENTSTEALLRASRPIEFDGHILTLGVYYSFHKERLENAPHRDLLEKTIEKVVGSQVRVICMLCEPPEKPKTAEDIVLIEPNGKPNESDKASVNSNQTLTDSKDEDIIKVAREIFES